MSWSQVTMIKAIKALLVGTVLAAVSGCVSLGGSEPPETLLTLTPAVSAPAGASASGDAGAALAVVEPDAPARLDVVRVAVQVDDANVAYLKDAMWVDKPARLFRSLLAETLRSRTGMVVIDSDAPALIAKTHLRGTLIDFGYDARANAVVVRFDAIRDIGDRVETRRFEAVVPGIPADAGFVGSAVNEAANEVAGQVADWLAGA